ncbi:MAG: 2-succinyl-5-enolpyruvyl-6-hydroxy-3-cyclohexene-1-carboxylic-acid synthase, partial [Tepidiformaceae bacterium]
HLDERSSAFFALGLARASEQPVAVVCTSGTAAANFHPAVVEAGLSRIPLILCTADRPPRLRDAGADQTTVQPGMFGRSVRWERDLHVPCGQPGEGRQFRATALRAVSSAMGPLPGPVHLNFPFEEPLMGAVGRLRAPWEGFGSLRTRAVYAPAAAAVAAAARAIAQARRPLIVAGPETGGLPANAIAALAARLDAPVLADPLSGLRTGPHDRSLVLDSYDAILRALLPGELVPDCVIRFGAKPTSKALNQFLAGQVEGSHIICAVPGGWRDPGALSSVVVHGSPEASAAALLAAAGSCSTEPRWSRRWLAANEAAGSAMREQSAHVTELFEGRVFTELQATLPPGATLFAGNSMPVRDLDSFLASDARPLTVVANRGAAGIDGVTSSALGAAAAGAGPVVLVVGDISFYHDMNGLWAAARHKLDLTIVLINNNGGGIFHYLPQAAEGDVFEDWFGTPTNLDFSHAVRMYGGTYTIANDWEAFRTALRDFRGTGLNVIELPTDRARNAEMHREIWAAAAAAVRDVLSPAAVLS